MKNRRAFWKKSLAGFDFWAQAGDCQFYPALAEWACDFFPKHLSLTTGKWAGQPFELQMWQQQIAGHLFGWLRPDGTRRFRKLFLYIPRKNGKTEFAAGLGVMFFVADDEPAAEVYCGAQTINQGNIFFRKTKKMIKNDPELCERVKPPKGRTSRTLYDENSDSTLQVLAADEEAAQGFNAHCGVIDELHTLKDGGFPGALFESMGTRRQPMLIEITTAADAGDGYCNSELDYAESVRDGRVQDETLMPIVFKASDKDDPGDPAVWKRANPSVGVTVPESYYRDQYRTLSKTASGMARFKKYFLNLQTSKTAGWIEREFWDACKANFGIEELIGKRCYLGIDRSSVSDISAVGMYFPDLSAFHCEFIVPRETADSNIAYDQWAKNGFIRVSEMSAIRDDELFELLEDIANKYDVISAGYDPWRMASLAEWVQKPKGENDGSRSKGLGIEMIPVGQSFRDLSGPTNNLEIMIRNGTIRHFNNPVLDWMFGNVRVAKDHKENIKLVKDNSNSPKKIDGIVTMVMAVKIANEETKKVEAFKEGVAWL